MRRVRNAIVLLALLGTAGWLSYRYLLSDEAKKGLHDAARDVKDAYEHIAEVMRAAQGTYVKEDLPNRRQTEAQWEELGL